MKKITLVSFLLLLAVSFSVTAQDKKIKKDSISSEYNKWTIQVNVGQAKGVKPYMA